MLRVVISDCFIFLHGRMSVVNYEALYDALSFQIAGAYYVPKVQDGKWDGVIRLLKRYRKVNYVDGGQTIEFPSENGPFLRIGLFHRLKIFLDQHNILYEVTNNQHVLCIMDKPELSPEIEHREEQIDAATALIKHRHGIVKLPPRTGKTTIMGIAIGMVPGLRPAVVFCEQVSVANQLQKELSKVLNQDVGIIAGKKSEVRDVTVVGYPRVRAALRGSKRSAFIIDLLKSCQMVLIDECHHATNYKVIYNMHNTKIVGGVSATPRREDGNALLIEEIIGPIVYKYTYAEAIRDDRLMPPTIDLFWFPHRKIAGISSMDYGEILDYVVNDERRNRVICSIANHLVEQGHSVAIIVNRKAHGRILADAIPGAVFLSGDDTDADYRAETFRRLVDKDLMCLVSTLIDEAINLPTLNSVIVAVSGKSVTRILQRMRMLTSTPDKSFCYAMYCLDDLKYFKEMGDRCHNLLEQFTTDGFTVREIDGSKIYENN